LLAFAQVLDEKLVEIAQRFDTPLSSSGCLLATKKSSSCAYWQRWNHLHHLLPGKFHLLMAAVSQAMQQTPRAFSGRESQFKAAHYFFLRRQLGPQYLDLQFSSTIARLCAVSVPNEWARVPPIDDGATPCSLAGAFGFRAVSTRLILLPKFI